MHHKQNRCEIENLFVNKKVNIFKVKRTKYSKVKS